MSLIEEPVDDMDKAFALRDKMRLGPYSESLMSELVDLGAPHDEWGDLRWEIFGIPHLINDERACVNASDVAYMDGYMID